MAAWDYKVLTLSRKPGFTESPGSTVPDDEALSREMATLGAQGWELVNVLRPYSGVTLFFKRPR